MSGLLLNPSAKELWSGNAVVSGTAREHHVPSMAAPLSIKAVRKGTAMWKVDSNEFSVNEDCFLIVNEGQPYEMEIDSVTPVETCCFFFHSGFVASEARPFALLLEGPIDGPTEFRSRLNPISRELSQALKTPGETAFPMLLRAMFAVENESRREPDRLDCVRLATRQEIQRRLDIARDAILSNLAEPLHLDDVAFEAGLSPFHFHRLFRATFGETPHGFLTRHRIERAKRLLRNTDWDLAEICQSVGYQSVGSFCRLFQRHTSQTPTDYRYSQDRTIG